MSKKQFKLWHPESPGIKVSVERNWIQQIIYPKEFATLGETIKAYRKKKK